jgi:aryl carrier-like protein
VQDSSIEDLDKRVEKALAKVLPGMLEAAIRKTFSQMLMELSSTTPSLKPAADRLPNDLFNGTQSNGVLRSGQHIRAKIYDVLAEDLDITGISDDTNLFNAGLDSLQVQALVSVLNDHLAKSKPGAEQLNVKSVYEKPTVREIISMIRI